VRQLTYVEAGRVEWQEAPDAVPPGPAGAVVRPLAVARCDLDLPMAMAGLFPGPFALGHETVAEVVAIGDQVRLRKPAIASLCRSRSPVERARRARMNDSAAARRFAPESAPPSDSTRPAVALAEPCPISSLSPPRITCSSPPHPMYP
jgi:hypothetical protein